MSSASSFDLRRLLPGIRRLEEYLGSVAGAASLTYAGIPVVTGIACRRRPRRRPCPGRIVVCRQEVPPRILWECPDCHDGGHLTGWQRTRWDLSAFRPGRRLEDDGDHRVVRLTQPQYDVLRREQVPNAEILAVVLGAQVQGGDILVEAPLHSLEEVAAWLAAEVERARGARRRPLDRVCDRFERALGAFRTGS